MTTYPERTIRWRIKKVFSCEATSEPICSEVIRAFTNGSMPIFQDVKCRCVSGGVERICQFSKEYIEKKMHDVGIIEMLNKNAEPDPNEEGEWR